MKAFVPKSLPLENIDWLAYIELIGKANYSLASYEGTLRAMVNPAVLLSPLTATEAVLSSKIEGTQATLQEVLSFEAEPKLNAPRHEDIKEINNYRRALKKAVQLLKARPCNLNMVRDLHAILLDSVRGKDKMPGEFRKDQNWIGAPGSAITKATYVPPAPMNLINHLSDWEKYWHYDEKDRIVQLAIVHAQFELIHPFKDGNGRIGRMLIPLFLYDKKMLQQPVFYMSEYLESNREEYYFRLKELSEKEDWTGWILFFLKGFVIQAIANRERAEKIIALYEKMKREIYNLNTKFALPALDTLFTMPIFNTIDYVKYSGIPRASSLRLVKHLKGKGYLKELKKGRPRNPGVFAFSQLINIAEGKDSSHR